MIRKLTQDWERRLLEGTHKALCTRTQEEGAVTPRETDPDLPASVQESPAEARVRGSDEAVQDLLKEVAIIFITSTIIWSLVKQMGGNTAAPINRKLD